MLACNPVFTLCKYPLSQIQACCQPFCAANFNYVAWLLADHTGPTPRLLLHHGLRPVFPPIGPAFCDARQLSALDCQSKAGPADHVSPMHADTLVPQHTTRLERW